MKTWMLALLIVFAIYVAIAVGAGLYMKSWRFGALWPLLALWFLFGGNVQ